MIEVIPAIMPKTKNELEKLVRSVHEHVPIVQLDVMDGVFVRNTSWPYGAEKEFRKMVQDRELLPFEEELDYGIDLMVDAPEHVIEDWMHLQVRRITVHIESTKHMENIIRDVEAHVTRALSENLEQVTLGIAINTTTPVERIEPYLFDVDFVQCMGIATIGKQGEPFDERVIGQIEEVKRRHPELPVSVDGGVSLETAPRLIEAGANRLVSGSAVFTSKDPKQAIEKLRALGA